MVIDAGRRAVLEPAMAFYGPVEDLRGSAR